ncbi:Protein STB3 [Cytospora mali]|uniref:Protein STB3 n=1 Tax=Cytospora mali TaxID=578113 RepID=A0A194VKN1_CYTMA|nr:Protein STB3 [Valsa mali]
MATMASAARDIQATSARDNLTAVAAQSVPVTRPHPLPLPTPPNSISPGLPPHGLRAQLLKAKLESDVPGLNLHDGHRDDNIDTVVHGSLGSSPTGPAGAITPAMLAKYHLPDILLNHGPLAIRHIMGYLTTSVPGFASMPPAKARRVVVGALEGRGSGGEGGGLDGDVEFEKVGWGRWDARRRGQPGRDLSPHTMQDASSPYMSGIPIAGGATWSNERTRLRASASSPDESVAFSHDERGFYLHDDDDADNMSMDGPASASCSEAPDEDVEMGDDPEDVTDDEDWAAIGAAGLRAQSYSKSAQPGTFPSSRFCATSSGMARVPQLNNIDFAALAATSDAQEREAIEALLRLGSV